MSYRTVAITGGDGKHRFKWDDGTSIDLAGETFAVDPDDSEGVITSPTKIQVRWDRETALGAVSQADLLTKMNALPTTGALKESACTVISTAAAMGEVVCGRVRFRANNSAQQFQFRFDYSTDVTGTCAYLTASAEDSTARSITPAAADTWYDCYSTSALALNVAGGQEWGNFTVDNGDVYSYFCSVGSGYQNNYIKVCVNQ